MRRGFGYSGFGFNAPGGLIAAADIGAIAGMRAVFDPYDLTSMFQTDVARTPVTGDDQQVGLWLDKRQMGGLTAAQYIAGRPELKQTGATGQTGTPPAPATYNTTTGQATCARTDAANQSFIRFSGLTVPGGGYVWISLTNTGATDIIIRPGDIGQASVATLSAGQTAEFMALAIGGFFTISCAAVNPTSASFTVNSFRFVPGNHAQQVTPTKRPKFRDQGGYRYLQGDGIDDCLQVTQQITMSDTNALSVGAALRKISDAASGVVIELTSSTSTTAGGFAVIAPATNATATVRFFARGTVAPTPADATGLAASVSLSAVATANIANDTQALSINGAPAVTGSGDMGSGNFAASILNLFSRNNGTSLPFGGKVGGLFVAGLALGNSDLLNCQRWLVQRTPLN